MKLRKYKFIRIPALDWEDQKLELIFKKKIPIINFLNIECDNDHNAALYFNRKCKIENFYYHSNINYKKRKKNFIFKNHIHALCKECYNKIKI